MRTLQLECLALTLSLLLLLRETRALPKLPQMSPLSTRPISGPAGLEVHGDRLREPIASSSEEHDVDYELPEFSSPDRTIDNESTDRLREMTHVLHDIEARHGIRLPDRVRAGLEELLHEAQQLLMHEDSERSAAAVERRLKRTGQNKGRRRAPYDFIVM